MLNTARNLVVLGRFNPAIFFANGEVGFTHDFSKTDRLKQLSDGTTAVGTDADPVGWSQSLDPTQRIAIQATADSRPAWKNPNFLRFDGVADNLLTTHVPAAAGSLAVKARVTSASKGLICSRGTASTAAELLVNSSGFIGGSVGTQTSTTINGGVDVRGLLGVYILTWDAVNSLLYRNGVLVNTTPRAGTVNTTIPFRIGARNDNGTAALFADADIYHALAINRVLTPAEVTKLTTGWGLT
ncbi:LamG-like jellyroll fold domain-containing protein [Mesorhizobium sp.]|uniref:LamG-like jellyroll fold domain-containing protein n=1 Tax=Mesorhizobium sp. TaxID=1871066 RepID=UPI0025DF5A39|nr:LamG-like jellyroll fold domain-containing protein [Mesorhizobium sp.]